MSNLIIDKIAAYFRGREEVVAVYLFGSYAAGNELTTSDIDLGLLFNTINPSLMENHLNRYLVELPRLIRKDIHPVAMNSAGELLLKQIFSKGKPILVKDPKEHDQFRMVMYSRILDYSYLLEKIKSGFVSHIMKEADDR